jgi:hypothetical protein
LVLQFSSFDVAKINFRDLDSDRDRDRDYIYIYIYIYSTYLRSGSLHESWSKQAASMRRSKVNKMYRL